jgi:hypothetical protein
MNGFDRLREQVKDQEDSALKQVIEYLISRDDMEQKYLNEEKNIKEMCNFIKEKGKVHAKNGWNFITNEVVFAWAIMYWALPNAFLKINTPKETKNIVTEEKTTKNNVVSINTAKKVLEEKKQVEQLTLFGGVTQ